MSNVFQSYHPDRTQGKFDAIVIGSGIGGMSCAALLAKANKKVLLLERHYTPGGFTHVFRRKNFSWDVGVHYIGEVHRPHSFLRLLFDDISEGRLKWQAMTDEYDRAIFSDGSHYSFMAGRKEFLERMGSYFPNQRKQLAAYMDLVYSVARDARSYFSLRAIPSAVAPVVTPFMGRTFRKFAGKSVLEVLRALGCDAKLIGVLTAQWGDYGLPPAQASFAMHAMVAKHYMAGGAYPIGGSGAIAKSIMPTITERGGVVLTRAEVKSIILDQSGERAVGVRMKDGHEILADMIISGAGYLTTYNNLLAESVAAADVKTSESIRPSSSHVGLYIGLKGSQQSLGLSATNQWIFPSYDHDRNVEDFAKDSTKPFPVVYVSFPSVKDPDWAAQHTDRSTVEVVSVMEYQHLARWHGTKWYQRGDDYLEFKNGIADRLMEVVYQHNPTLRGNIEVIEVSTPLSTKHFANYGHGEIYGLDHHPKRFAERCLRPVTKTKGLYLTGQDVVTAGVGGAMMGGLLTASVILRDNLAKRIVRQSNLES